MNKPIQIAIVDDHNTLRLGLATLLRNNGYDVIIEACNGQDFIQKLKVAETIPQICITDIEMPVMNGYEMTEYLKRQYPKIKVLVFSFYEHEFSIINILKKGAVGYIFKSADPDEIITAIESIKKIGYYHSEGLIEKSPIMLYNYNNINLEFSDVEKEFLTLSCSDLGYDEIAKLMNVSKRTIDNYRDSCYEKLKINSRPALVLFTLQTGIVAPYKPPIKGLEE